MRYPALSFAVLMMATLAGVTLRILSPPCSFFSLLTIRASIASGIPSLIAIPSDFVLMVFCPSFWGLACNSNDEFFGTENGVFSAVVTLAFLCIGLDAR